MVRAGLAGIGTRAYSPSFLNLLSLFALFSYKCKYEEYIEIFMTAYRALDLTIPVKFHLLEKHCAQFLKMYKEEHGLGYFSEQAMESCHSEMKRDLLAEKQVSVNHPNYGEKLVNLISRVNGKHV